MSEFTLSPGPIPQLRRPYFASLEEPQEFFLEALVSAGQFWTHSDGSYGVTHGKTLVEFFSPSQDNSTRLLRRLQDQTGFSAALVKSYDRDLMRCFGELGWVASTGGSLFRKRETREQTAFLNAAIKAALSTDVDPLWKINDDFFESKKEIAALTQEGKLWTVTVDGRVAGCGVSNRFLEDSDAVDIGMMVAPSFRRRGLGTHIVSEVANQTEQRGLRPICGCGASNVASKAALEKAGFVSEHQLIAFAARSSR